MAASVISRRDVHSGADADTGIEIKLQSRGKLKKDIQPIKERLPNLMVFALTAGTVFALVMLTGVVNYLESAGWAEEDGAWKVDKETCSCSCWDRRIKGKAPPFPKGPYKAMYINSEATTVWMMLLTVFYVTSAVKLFEKIWDLVVFKRDQIRIEYLLVLPPMFYANIYSWWATIMYLNDAWYKMIKHQSYFAVTEWIATLAVYQLLDKKGQQAHSLFSWAIFTITATHTLQNVINGSLFGATDAPLRDLVLMVPDLLLVILSFRDLGIRSKLQKNSKQSEIIRKQLIMSVAIIILSLLLLTFVIPTPW